MICCKSNKPCITNCRTFTLEKRSNHLRIFTHYLLIFKTFMMKTKTTLNLNGSLAIGGGLLAGLGAGFLYLQTNALLFVACLLGGLGIGLILASIIGKEKSVAEKEMEARS